MRREPISRTWPPKCLQARPCPNSCAAATTKMASHASSTVSTRERRARSRAISALCPITMASATPMKGAERATKDGVKQNRTLPMRRSRKGSGLKARNLRWSRSPRTRRACAAGAPGPAPGVSSSPRRRSVATNPSSTSGVGRTERLLGPIADLSERGGAIQLARDEVFDLSEPKELSRRRILDYDETVLAAGDEIAPELGLRGCHRYVKDRPGRTSGRPAALPGWSPPAPRQGLGARAVT